MYFLTYTERHEGAFRRSELVLAPLRGGFRPTESIFVVRSVKLKDDIVIEHSTTDRTKNDLTFFAFLVTRLVNCKLLKFRSAHESTGERMLVCAIHFTKFYQSCERAKRTIKRN